MQEDMKQPEIKWKMKKSTRSPGVIILQRIIWLLAGTICTLITLRFVFLILGANQDAEFTSAIYTLSAPFVAPFVGVFGEPTYGRSTVEISSILGLIIYPILAKLLSKLITIARPRQEQ